MKMLASLLTCLLGLSAFAGPGDASSSYPDPERFEKQIKKFEKADAKQMPPNGAVLCVGRSSIRLWHGDLAKDLAPLTVIGRGFGGSNTNDLLHYADRIVFKYQPRAIMIYQGDNDVAQAVTSSVAFATDDKKGRLIPARLNTNGQFVNHTLTATSRFNFPGVFAGGEEFAEYGFPFELWGDPGRDDFEPFYQRLNTDGTFNGNAVLVHGYQYFGGMEYWLNVPGNTSPDGRVYGLSPVKLDDMTSEQTMIADMLYVRGTWGDLSSENATAQQSYAGSPAHGLKGSGTNAKPKGGNHVFADGSGRWVDFSETRELQSHSASRNFYYYQEDLGDQIPAIP